MLALRLLSGFDGVSRVQMEVEVVVLLVEEKVTCSVDSYRWVTVQLRLYSWFA